MHPRNNLETTFAHKLYQKDAKKIIQFKPLSNDSTYTDQTKWVIEIIECLTFDLLIIYRWKNEKGNYEN
jgi:hypothetical protein